MAKTTKEDLAKIIGERLKELRKATKDIGQKDVADELGITKQAISNYESGRNIPDLAILIDLAEYYSCSMDYILGLEDTLNKISVDTSEKSTVNELNLTLGMIANDERDFMTDGFIKLVKALSISKGNPERRNFIAHIGELFLALAEYIEFSTINGKNLIKQSKENTATNENISVIMAHIYGFDDIDSLIESIKRIGVKAVISFSVNAKKALRIRTGWRDNKQTSNSKHTD